MKRSTLIGPSAAIIAAISCASAFTPEPPRAA